LGSGGEGALGKLERVAEDGDILLALELLDEVVHQTVIEILATQMGVTGDRLHLKNTPLDGQQGHIKRASTKVEDENVHLNSGTLLVETVGNGSGGRHVDNAQAVEAGKDSSALGRLHRHTEQGQGCM
jgi:hypothetical protein